MRRNRLIGLCLCGMLCTVTSVQAAPLTDFDTWRGSVDLGAWRTDVSLSNDNNNCEQSSDCHLNLADKWRLYGGITHGLGGPWGLQYMYHGMAADDTLLSEYEYEYEYGDGYEGEGEYDNYYYWKESFAYKGHTNELNLLYSLKKAPGVALFVGANRVHNELRYTYTDNFSTGTNTWEGARTHFQGGVMAKAPLSDKVDAFGLVGFGSHSLFQAEAGIAFKMKNDWEANVGYRWFRVKDAFDESNGNGIDPIGTVKVKGIKFGITHYFGPSPKKEEPQIVTPPVVITPSVEEPPVVKPPISEMEQELLDKKKVILKGVNFDFDYDTLQPQGYPILDQVVDVANKYPQWNFLLVGHTDSYGSDEYNIDLSRRRVQTVQRYLVDKGIAEYRLTIDAKGEREPIASNATDEGRAENRRVELSVK